MEVLVLFYFIFLGGLIFGFIFIGVWYREFVFRKLNVNIS